jgi:hypothetical protein
MQAPENRHYRPCGRRGFRLAENLCGGRCAASDICEAGLCRSRRSEEPFAANLQPFMAETVITNVSKNTGTAARPAAIVDAAGQRVQRPANCPREG